MKSNQETSVPKPPTPVPPCTSRDLKLPDVVKDLHIIIGPSGICFCGTGVETCGEMLARMSEDIRRALIMANCGGQRIDQEGNPVSVPGSHPIACHKCNGLGALISKDGVVNCHFCRGEGTILIQN